MDLTLDPEEIRVLGSLVEKEVTTPEYYPLSLNALLNACNQKSNRDPVVHWDEETLERALYTLREKGLLISITGAGSRVPKYSHRISEKLNLGRRELALLCELMLRGPQTPGELRSRAERMHPFEDLGEVESVLDRMPELVTKLPRRPGEKEARYAHLLSGEPPVSDGAPEIEVSAAPPSPGAPPAPSRIAVLEAEIAQLRRELDELKQQFAGFQKQFE
ncbi:MAG TPA: YceH family protein [Bryobacteraceae bacterium]|nr:YceH family protein [Bryobacteraceae bacterium]